MPIGRTGRNIVYTTDAGPSATVGGGVTLGGGINIFLVNLPG